MLLAVAAVPGFTDFGRKPELKQKKQTTLIHVL
jgi:hypothetical protein